MSELTAAFRIFFWFLSQAVFVGGVGFVYFIVPFLLLVAVLVRSYIQKKDRQRLLPLIIVLPLIWIFLGLWGGFFWSEPNHVSGNPAWVGYPLQVAPWLFFLLIGFFLWRLKGARLFVVCYALINFYFSATMLLLAGMAISGDWL